MARAASKPSAQAASFTAPAQNSSIKLAQKRDCLAAARRESKCLLIGAFAGLNNAVTSSYPVAVGRGKDKASNARALCIMLSSGSTSSSGIDSTISLFPEMASNALSKLWQQACNSVGSGFFNMRDNGSLKNASDMAREAANRS